MRAGCVVPSTYCFCWRPSVRLSSCSLCLSVSTTGSVARPHLEYCVSVWSPHYTKDKELLERVQHRFTRMIKEVRDKDYLDRLKEVNLWTLEERRNRADLIELFYNCSL